MNLTHIYQQTTFGENLLRLRWLHFWNMRFQLLQTTIHTLHIVTPTLNILIHQVIDIRFLFILAALFCQLWQPMAMTLLFL